MSFITQIHASRHRRISLPVLIALSLIFTIRSVSAQEVRVAVGMALPPYILQATNSGMELDIAREALALKGHTITPVYLPFARVGRALTSKNVDAALTTNEGAGLENVYLSNSHIRYQNVAVSLREQGLKLSDVADLAGYSVFAFQNATRYLGKAFADMAANSSHYFEKANQAIQIKMLFSERIDLIVLDINIFKYYRQNETEIDTSAPVTIHTLFPPTFYKVSFLDEDLRDQFNDGLAELRRTGKYDEIIGRYIR